MEPQCQMSVLFRSLMQHAVRIARQLGHRYMLGACEDNLVRMYRDMGFAGLETGLAQVWGSGGEHHRRK
jgi:hypothetical protein